MVGKRRYRIMFCKSCSFSRERRSTLSISSTEQCWDVWFDWRRESPRLSFFDEFSYCVCIRASYTCALRSLTLLPRIGEREERTTASLSSSLSSIWARFSSFWGLSERCAKLAGENMFSVSTLFDFGDFGDTDV